MRRLASVSIAALWVLALSGPARADVVTPAAAPTVAWGTPDCVTLTLPVTLDNSTGDAALTFHVLTERVDHSEADGGTYIVAAGDAQEIEVALPADEMVTVVVTAGDDADDTEVGSLQVACRDPSTTTDPKARIGAIDCSTLTVPVRLDNSRSTGRFRFAVHHGDIESYEDGDPSTRVVVVAAGDVRTVTVAVPRGGRLDSEWWIGVGWAGSDWTDVSLAYRWWGVKDGYGAVVTGCRAADPDPSTAEPDPGTSALGETLAVTGGGETGPGALAGAALLTVGVALIAAATPRRRHRR